MTAMVKEEIKGIEKDDHFTIGTVNGVGAKVRVVIVS